MFKVAIPNKGSLSQESVQMLKEAGYRTRRNDRQLVVQDVENNIEFFYLRPRDIAIYVGSGILNAGITGLDLLLDSGSEAELVTKLGFAGSTFRFAAPRPLVESEEYISVKSLQGKRIASAYQNLTLNYLHSKNIKPAKVVKLDGAVESSIQLGVADVIADVVSTGTTMRNAGLEIFGDPILKSEAVLIRSKNTEESNTNLQVLEARLRGVVTAREYVLMDFDIPTNLVEKSTEICPGFQSPTISSLANGDSAVRVMIRKKEMNDIMDKLYELGARGILITSILASRL
ncbi:MAG: ATP phosphoribosyltransferase [Candidatus Ancillula sp.]|nr:ATP phosphoribosyltransferase [Candidatus Ancillula sp.]